ncbi:MAG: IS66 family transposase [Salinisphaera sp.]|nr:IS66 family transposase [Salinisphaera sp.]
MAQGALPATQTAFQALLGTLSTQVETYVADTIRALYEELREQIRLDRQRLFGARSEAHPLQGSLFNEAEWAADEAAVADDGAADTQAASEPGTPAPTSGPRRTHGGRQPLPPELPRVEVKLDLGEAERPCGTCGQDRVQIGETVSEQLNIVPMRIEVIRTIRSRYACPAGHVAPVVAPLPPTALPRTNFAPGFLATLLTTKYVDGLPLNRFAKVLQRHGVTVSRQTLARTVIATAKVLQPLANLAWDTVLEAPVIHMDETPVQVLKEPGKAPQSKSYMWVAKGGPPARPVVLYTYDPGRSGQVPLTLLEGWRGYLMTDGYEGYSAIAKRDRVEHLVCLVHARRKFVEAKRASPKGKATRADQALAFFARLYRIEAGVKEQDAATRWQARLHQSRPVLEQLRAWLTATRPVVTPKSKLGEALAYLDKYWPKLTRYTERGDLPIDNNPCENAIRPFVLGRKAWLFADTQAGAKASALLYSLVETAKANGLEPYTWLHHVLARLPAVTTVAGYEALMPWNVHPENLVEMSATA